MVDSRAGSGEFAMRILICSNAYPPNFVGGAELMAHEQAKALVRLGHDVRVFAGELNSQRNRYARVDDVHDGIHVLRIALSPEDYSPEFLNFMHPAVDSHFRDVLQEFNPDIVHCHNVMGLSAKLPVLARQSGAGTVCTLHDFWGFCLRNTATRPDGQTCHNLAQCRSCLPRIHDGRRLHVPMRFRKDFIKMALDQVDRFIAPSGHIAQRYVEAGLSEKRLTIVRNGVDIDRFRPRVRSTYDDHARITYAGYFGAHKGVVTLLEALARLPALLRDGVTATVQLVGEGPEDPVYRAKIAALELQDSVRFLGKVASCDMPGVYAESEIVVLPSVWDENQPVCLMEAMASGLPVVASRKGGIPELIDHGCNGFMFVAGDAQDLAVQLAKLMNDPCLLRRAGQEGRRRVKHMSHDNQARHLTEVYAKTSELARGLVHSHELYAVTGDLRRKMLGENYSLGDERYPSRYFIPLKWIADCMGPVDGIVLTGWLWSALRLLGVDAVIPWPRAFRKVPKIKVGRK
jgi:glycosyltransferase involved in cell wall biosynthesis